MNILNKQKGNKKSNSYYTLFD